MNEVQENFRYGSKAGRPTSQKIAALWAWLICPTIILLSYMPVLNYVARGVFFIFVVWFFTQVLLNGKRLYWIAPTAIYLFWGLYSLGASAFALDVELSIHKWFTVFLLGTVTLAAANSVVWCGSIRPWAWAYMTSIILAVMSNYLPIQNLLIPDYETETLGRTVGTFGNANTYGRAMVQGCILAFILLFGQCSKMQRVILFVFIGMLCLAVLQSGSRTAFVGCALVLVGALFCAGWAVVTIKNIFLSALGSFGLAFIVFTFPERFVPAFERMRILLSHLGIGPVIKTREKSLEHRAELMDNAWNVWLEHPMGVGLDNYQLISGVYAHSNYLELLASVGLFGVIFYYCAYWVLYRRALQAKRNFDKPSQYKILVVFILIMLVMDISNVSYYTKPLWLLIGIIGGYIYLTKSEHKGGKIG